MIIKKNELPALLATLSEHYRVYAPVAKGDDTFFETLTPESKLNMGASPKKPVKEILFPQTEELYNYSVDNAGVRMESALDDTKTVAFGVKPCDAKAMALLDNVFHNDQYQDVYYLSRRNNTIIVTLGCNQPESTCFCSSVNSGPFDTDGSDILLTDIGEAYLVEGITEQGKGLLAELKLEAADDTAKAQAADNKKVTATSSIVDISGLKEKLDGMFNDAYWDKLHEKCIGCAACTYLCPTCHCFDIADEAKDCAGCRVRNWDSCMFPLFTLHGSGHNPRTSGKERWRQRLMHKFNYFVERYNATACVGCGRCIKNCPVNLDIRQVLSEVQAQDGSEVN